MSSLHSFFQELSNEVTNIGTILKKIGNVLLCLLSWKLLWIFSSNLPEDFALKNGGVFWWIFSGLRFPRSDARKLHKKFRENSEQNSGQNPGRKSEKFRELSFCNFSDLKCPTKGQIGTDDSPFQTPPVHRPLIFFRGRSVCLGIAIGGGGVSGSRFSQ